ncbi:MAG: hypothetical protein KF897_07690 [Opitutaceae bacterium]|nr:hypothetical protein [Opitutaceae bacterium]
MKLLYTLLRLVGGLLLASLPAVAATRTVLFVSQTKPAPAVSAADALIQEHLAALGFTVTFADQTESAQAAKGKDLVILSSGLSAHRLEGKFRAVPVPVIVCESYTLPHMGMTGRRQEQDFGTQEGKFRYVWLVNAPHPLAAGLPAGMVNVVKKGGAMNWGRPGAGAIVIATLPGELDKSPTFAYEKGATMEGENLAPARRVFLFLDGDAFPNLNEAGLKLFDAAVRWASSSGQE